MATETHYVWVDEKWQCKDDLPKRPKPVVKPESAPKPVQARPKAPARGRKPKEAK